MRLFRTNISTERNDNRHVSGILLDGIEKGKERKQNEG